MGRYGVVGRFSAFRNNASISDGRDTGTDVCTQVTWDKIKDRDSRFGVDMSKKRQARMDIAEMTPHQDADSCWK